jgi:type IV secretory pathway TraG/TraD family ATPase VirD4
MKTNDRLDVYVSRLSRASLLFTLFFPAAWIAWVFSAFQSPDRATVIQYGLGRLLFTCIQVMNRLVVWVASLSGTVKEANQWNDVWVVRDILNFLRRYYQSIDERIVTASFWIFVGSLAVACFGTWLLIAAFGPSTPTSDERILRGAQVVGWRQLAWRTRISSWKWWLAEERKRQMFIGQVPIPSYVETRHVLLVGSTGAGKSQALYQIAAKIRSRGDRALVLDLNGALLSRFGAAGDRLLNPLDKRSVKWNPFLDIVDKGDVESLVKATIPTVQGEAEEWRGYARTVMQAVLLKLKETEDAQPSRVVYFATHAGIKELAKLCEGTSAQRYFEKGSEKLLSNTLTVLSEGVRSWAELQDGGTFSMRQWIREGSGWLFVNVRDKEFDLMCPLMSSWVWIAITEALSLPEDDTRRLWFLLDELASYNQLPKLNEALSKLRKYGGCVVAALQDVAQLDFIYGPAQARSLRNCFSTYIALRCEDPDTADYAARRVGGEQEIEKERISTTSAPQSRSQTRTVDVAPRQALLGSEVSQLPDLVAYLKVSGDYSAAKIKIPVSRVQPRVSRFERHE